MTTTEVAARAQESPPTAYERGSDQDRASRFWRTVWRLHFYAGIAVIPFVVILAVTGTLILYKDPLNDLAEGNLRKVVPLGEALSLDDQIALVAEEYPDLAIGGVTPPRSEDHATMVARADGEATEEVYVDPYKGEILGAKTSGEDLPALAERIHGNLLMGWKLPMPTLGGITGETEPLTTDVDFGDLLVELMAGWGFVLVVTGVYLWWPRKRQAGKALFVPRLGKKGRGRWRDLHAIPGALLSLVVLFLVVTGLPWSGFWGGNWDYIVAKADGTNLGAEEAGPTSETVTVGDLDRFGNPIPWAIKDNPVPRSGDPGGHHGGGETGEPAATGDGDAPALLSLDDVAAAAREEGLRPGYSISLPVDTEAEDGDVAYGVYTLSNPSPTRIEWSRSVFLDQFNGEKVGETASKDKGFVARTTSLGIDIHQGTQFGLINRIVMTVVCICVVWSAISGTIMWWKRRPQGKVGLPRRPVDVGLARGLVILAVVLGIIFPLVGLSMIVVLLADRYLIRRVAPLRRAFGMR